MQSTSTCAAAESHYECDFVLRTVAADLNAYRQSQIEHLTRITGVAEDTALRERQRARQAERERAEMFLIRILNLLSKGTEEWVHRVPVAE